MRTLDIYTTTNMYNMSDLNRHDVIGLQSVSTRIITQMLFVSLQANIRL